MARLKLIASALLLAAAAWAQQPTVGGVVNAASYAAAGLPNAGVARGSIFTVFGSNMGPAQLQQVQAFPLPTTLGGTSVQVTVGGQTVNAIMLYTSAGQVAAVLPSNTPTGTGTIRVTFNGQQSATAPITVVESAFGTFAQNAAGSGPGVVFNFNAGSGAQTLNQLNNATAPGQIVIVYGTGLGPITGGELQAPPVQNRPDLNVSVFIGGQRADVLYQGRQGSSVGLDQINVRVPQGLSGCYVPVAIQVGNVVSNYTTISVAPTAGTACSDPNGISQNDLNTLSGKTSARTGSISLSRTIVNLSAGGVNINTTSDNGFASFEQLPIAQYYASQGTVSVGNCVVYTQRGSETPTGVPDDPFRPLYLDAGNLSVSNAARGTKQFTRDVFGSYSATLGGGLAIPFPGAPPVDPPYLDSGAFTVTATGGAAGPNRVGPFSATINIGQNLTWNELNTLTTINRAAGQRISWTGGDPSSYVNIVGISSTGTAQNSVSGIFFCVERVSRGSFTVPPSVLLALPASATSPDGALGFMQVGTVFPPARFTAEGLDFGYLVATSGTVKNNITFQ